MLTWRTTVRFAKSGRRQVKISLLRMLTAAYMIAMLAPAHAEPLAAPSGKPILVVSGAISETNVDGTAQFDRAMLEAMGTVTVETRTPWYDGVRTFEGVRLDALMEAVGASGETVRAVALNDYVATMPVQDFARFGTILALKRDGEYMSVREHGPLFIIYPFDSDPELQSQTYFGRSVWQLAKLAVE